MQTQFSKQNFSLHRVEKLKKTCATFLLLHRLGDLLRKMFPDKNIPNLNYSRRILLKKIFFLYFLFTGVSQQLVANQ